MKHLRKIIVPFGECTFYARVLEFVEVECLVNGDLMIVYVEDDTINNVVYALERRKVDDDLPDGTWDYLGSVYNLDGTCNYIFVHRCIVQYCPITKDPMQLDIFDLIR